MIVHEHVSFDHTVASLKHSSMTLFSLYPISELSDVCYDEKTAGTEEN